MANPVPVDNGDPGNEEAIVIAPAATVTQVDSPNLAATGPIFATSAPTNCRE